MFIDTSSKKSGFGAQRVKTNFENLEATAKHADSIVTLQPEKPKEK